MDKKKINRYREEESLEESNSNSEIKNEEEVTKCEEIDNEKLSEKIKFLENEVLRAKADQINFKKRLEDEKQQAIKFANQTLLEDFVEQIDLFDSVIKMKTEDPVLKNFLLGFEMINNNFHQLLNDQGVKKIEVNVGEKMDPRFHHALQVDYDQNYEEGVILQVFKTGYMFKDRILRPSIVKVNKKEKKENE